MPLCDCAEQTASQSGRLSMEIFKTFKQQCTCTIKRLFCSNGSSIAGLHEKYDVRCAVALPACMPPTGSQTESDRAWRSNGPPARVVDSFKVSRLGKKAGVNLRISPVCATRSAAGRKKRAKRRQRSAFPPPAIHPPRRRRGACPPRPSPPSPASSLAYFSESRGQRWRAGSEGSAAAGHGQGHSAAIARRHDTAERVA